MSKKIQIIGAPMDLGQSRRGVDMGPSAIRYAGLQEHLQRLGLEIVDIGNLSVPNPEEEKSASSSGLKHLATVAKVNHQLAQAVWESLLSGFFPIILGGDHSIAAGSAAGACVDERTGLIWVDAHGDFNTPQTSPSGNLHGMPLSALVGKEPREMAHFGQRAPYPAQNIALIGVRDLDPGEKSALKQTQISLYTMRDIDEWGMAKIVHRCLEKFHQIGVRQIHLSFDLDVLDPQLAPGVGTPVPGGLQYREAHLLMELLSEDGRVQSLDLVEVNPILDYRNRTAEIAVELVESLMGKRII